MELREVLGRRRSIRFLRPYKPVEPDKVQRMLEAARRASHWGNVQSLRAVVVFKDVAGQPSAPEEIIDAIEAPVAGWQINRAPVVIVWYLDPVSVEEQGDRLRELNEAGALGFGPKDLREEKLEEELIPMFETITEALKEPGLGEVDCGQGIAQATLMAFEQGLGTCCLATQSTDEIQEQLGIPDRCRILVLQTVGYPAEGWQAGGQRPRQPFEDLFHMNEFGNEYQRDEDVVEELKEDGFITEPAPLPYREEELEFLKRALELEEHEPGLL